MPRVPDFLKNLENIKLDREVLIPSPEHYILLEEKCIEEFINSLELDSTDSTNGACKLFYESGLHSIFRQQYKDTFIIGKSLLPSQEKWITCFLKYLEKK